MTGIKPLYSFFPKNKMDIHSDSLVMIVVAHPDDEVIGASTFLIHHKHILFVHITDGAPIDLQDSSAAGFTTRQAYSHARYNELKSALEIVNSNFYRSIHFNIIDKQALFNIPCIITDLISVMTAYEPCLILTHAYEGGHPDHDATAFSVWEASRLYKQYNRCSLPVIEFAAYNGNNSQFNTYEFIPYDHHETITIFLDNQEQCFKKKMFDTFVTQKKTISTFPVHIECYRTQPDYNFLNPPHDGLLWYEHLKCGITKDKWSACIQNVFSQFH